MATKKTGFARTGDSRIRFTFYQQPDLLKFWKWAPLRIPAGYCNLCREPTVFVRWSRGGGSVGQACSCSPGPTIVPAEYFKGLNLWMPCPKCGDNMEPVGEGFDHLKPKKKDFVFVCRPCKVAFKFGDLLPNATDVFGD